MKNSIKTKLDRRQFLSLTTASLAAPYALTVPYTLTIQSAQANTLNTNKQSPNNNDIDLIAAQTIFDLSVASGDPTDSGVILWTHINPDHYDPQEALIFQVSTDPSCATIMLEGSIAASSISPANDHTIKIDLNHQLGANQYYYYRFYYKGVSSRIGRCKTLPQEGHPLKTLKMAVLSCQDYTNGYYGALHYVAQDNSIDFVVHLGDFIYESAGDPRFQSLPFADRTIILPSNSLVALDLEDYRHLYKTYRSDADLQRAMEMHTWIMTTDDHETANDAYWDYERDTLGAPDHPFTTKEGNDPAALKQLKLDSQQSWIEYTPTRISVNKQATHPHDYTRIYRSFKFGDLFEIFMLDTRTYRSAHPCGEGDIFARYLPIGCNEMQNDKNIMMGEQQFNWLKNGLKNSQAQWTVLGNQTYLGRMTASLLGQPLAYINVDAWDGYIKDRDRLMEAVKEANLENFIVLTGDLHSHISAYVKYDYSHLTNLWWPNIAGTEFMTPAVTSSNLFESIASQAQNTNSRYDLGQMVSESAIRLNNPHIRYFNSSSNGYSTVEFTREYCEWTAYSVDKHINSESATRTLIKKQRKMSGWAWLEDIN